ncbi:hypothetical protein A4R35_09780 [Thermogemmatispora tikiterensis]|uniref:Uncharacterized protein n=1 Tax=Thermogemmatispora tikiterensis TaxID=1825093 RepID=A0A328VNS7_9CHLR|nr:hypothetical protein A4R35_09780 [Thermogemmatispora tikiterensis]
MKEGSRLPIPATGRRARVQGDVDAHHEGMRKEGVHLESPDAGAGAHIQDGAGALRSERGQGVVAQSAIQGMVLIVEPLILEGIFGQQRGHALQIAALGEGGRRPVLGGCAHRRCRHDHGGGSGGRLDSAAPAEKMTPEGHISTPFVEQWTSSHQEERIARQRRPPCGQERGRWPMPAWAGKPPLAVPAVGGSGDRATVTQEHL